MYFDKLADLDNETTRHIIDPLKITPDVKGSKYIEFGVENNEKDSKYQIGSRVKIFK